MSPSLLENIEEQAKEEREAVKKVLSPAPRAAPVPVPPQPQPQQPQPPLVPQQPVPVPYAPPAGYGYGFDEENLAKKLLKNKFARTAMVFFGGGFTGFMAALVLVFFVALALGV